MSAQLGPSKRRGGRYGPHFVQAVRLYEGSWRMDKPLKCSRPLKNTSLNVEPLNDARTPLVNLFNNLLGVSVI